MLAAGPVLAIAAGYLLLLFGLAFFTDRLAARGRAGLIRSPLVYTLSLTVYCTSWTFYGAVGSAARNGLEFATIYLGPTLVFLGWFFVLRKLVRISKAHRITSIADFISSRYGKSTRVAVVVTLMAVAGTTPYIALQLKAVTTSLDALIAPGASAALGDAGLFADTGFWVAVLMAIFVILFGTRNIGADEHHPGVVAAIAFESLVKLLALLAVGLFVVFGIQSATGAYEGATWLDPALRDLPPFQPAEGNRWVTMLILSACAIICLPRQFQVTVVEVTDERHLRTAAWMFPLYLFLISLFTVPIAVVGLALDSGNPDLFVLTVPLSHGQELLALAAFIGGLSSATSMVIVECIALSIMISNQIVVPALLRIPAFRIQERSDLTRLLLASRRASIVIILTLGFLYYRIAAQGDALAAIGLIAFAGAAQFLPALLGGILWRGGTERGALAGLIAGFALWAYTIVLPSVERAGWLSTNLLTDGLFGLPWLRPENLFGATGWDPLVHTVFWSFAANIGLYVAVSLFTRQGPLERLQSTLFVDTFRKSPGGDGRVWVHEAAVEDLMALTRRILGPERTREAFDRFADSQRTTLALLRASPALVSYVERQLAGSIGAASARVMVSRVAGGETISLDEVIKILDETQQAIEYGQRLEQKSAELEDTAAQLRRANAQLKELDRMKDDFLSRVSHELRTPMTSIHSFAEILLRGEGMAPGQDERFLSIIFAESQRLIRLLDEILDLSGLERGTRRMTMVRLDAVGVLRNAAATMAAPAQKRGAELRFGRMPETAVILGDADRLKQVFINLLHNAIKFNDKPQPLITVDVTAEDGRVLVSVTDNGPGVPEEDRAAIFEKFPRRWLGAEGSGLGLAISKQIVDQLGGTISVTAADGGGARFTVVLPEARQPAFAN